MGECIQTLSPLRVYVVPVLSKKKYSIARKEIYIYRESVVTVVYIQCFSFDINKVWGKCECVSGWNYVKEGCGEGCIMTSGLSKNIWHHVWPQFFFLNLQITWSDIKPHIKWAPGSGPSVWWLHIVLKWHSRGLHYIVVFVTFTSSSVLNRIIRHWNLFHHW